jgi:hypothetical protein
VFVTGDDGLLVETEALSNAPEAELEAAGVVFCNGVHCSGFCRSENPGQVV